jgi:aminoglycoside phosphotransferase (APT) family kinase protein
VAAVDAQATVPADPALPTVVELEREELQGWRRLLAAPQDLTPWQERHLAALVELDPAWEEAATGNPWLHLDSRADNMLVRPDGTAVLVDWPWSAAGNPAFDALGFVPAAVRDGALGVVGPGVALTDVPDEALGEASEELFQRFAAAALATEDQATALLVAFTGLMEHCWRQPPPPGLPTVRGFQRSQGHVAGAWLRHRLGWR